MRTSTRKRKQAGYNSHAESQYTKPLPRVTESRLPPPLLAVYTTIFIIRALLGPLTMHSGCCCSGCCCFQCLVDDFPRALFPIFLFFFFFTALLTSHPADVVMRSVPFQSTVSPHGNPFDTKDVACLIKKKKQAQSRERVPRRRRSTACLFRT